MTVDLSDTLVVILAGGKGQRLEPLTRDRAKPAVPFGGIYRIIDFTLSNCLNSDLHKVLVLVQYRSRSLNSHLRDGWQVFFNPAVGEFLEPLPPQHGGHADAYSGTADAVHQNLFAVREEDCRAVLILAGDHIYKMDYRHMLRFHAERHADLTVGAVEVPVSEGSNFGILQVDTNSRIVGFQEKPKEPRPLPANPDVCLASMGIYVFDYEVMEAVLREDARDPKSSHDFGRDIIPRMVGGHSVYAFPFVDENRKEAKYWRDVGTIDAYYDANMDLVSVSPHLNLYDRDWLVRTVPVMAPPPKFVFAQEVPGGRLGIALDSTVSPGCIVSGGRVQNSILSPNVRINSYSLVEGSILFENVTVGRHAKIRRAIVDKDVTIPEGMEIGYDLERDRRKFTVSEGGVVVISKRTVL
ncbi:MAG: glucose-1-phosphate adenylyltransferase [Planctomycetes bacterium]|nr:glucose-1-phosphate adenylyltransferase [Planctomycetota bacterium]